jgi:plastocyanin
MKTNFTFKIYCFFATIFILALSLNLKAQTSHDVTASGSSFSPSNLTITVGDEVVWTNNSGSHNVDGLISKFPSNPESFGNAVGAGWTYKFTFNTAGTYDYQCDIHGAMGMVGKITVNPKQATGPFTLTVNFTGMTPHVGENLWLAVIDQATKIEIGRVKKSVTSAAFSIDVAGIESGKSYNVDFFADHNKNGVYNVSPVDHSWRLQLNNVTGNSVLNFAHNTTFTDIAWKNKLTVHFTGMTPHLGEKITLFLKQTDVGIYRDTVIVPLVAAATFDINSFKIKPGISYNIDFYADHNKNGTYDTPPTDHAWRIPLLNVKGDSLINFVHNTTFTDIFSVTSNESLINDSKNIRLYPNPASQYIQVLVPKTYSAIDLIKIFSITGEAIDEKTFPENQESLRFDISQLKNGIYFMEISAGNQRNVMKFIKQ